MTVNGTALPTEPCTPFPVDDLAATGMNLRPLCGIGFALLLAGSVLVFATRRRKAG